MSRNPGWDQRIEDGLWRTKKGEILRLSEMTEEHIQKCIYMMEDRLKVSAAITNLTKVTQAVLGHIPKDIAAYEVDEAEARIKKQIASFKEELGRRGWQ